VELVKYKDERTNEGRGLWMNISIVNLFVEIGATSPLCGASATCSPNSIYDPI